MGGGPRAAQRLCEGFAQHQTPPSRAFARALPIAPAAKTCVTFDKGVPTDIGTVHSSASAGSACRASRVMKTSAKACRARTSAKREVERLRSAYPVSVGHAAENVAGGRCGHLDRGQALDPRVAAGARGAYPRVRRAICLPTHAAQEHRRVAGTHGRPPHQHDRRAARRAVRPRCQRRGVEQYGSNARLGYSDDGGEAARSRLQFRSSKVDRGRPNSIPSTRHYGALTRCPRVSRIHPQRPVYGAAVLCIDLRSAGVMAKVLDRKV